MSYSITYKSDYLLGCKVRLFLGITLIFIDWITPIIEDDLLIAFNLYVIARQ